MEEWIKKNRIFVIVVLTIVCFLVVKRLFRPSRKRKEKKPRIFISHSWDNDQDYHKLKRLLNNKGLKFYDHSISEQKADKTLKARQIKYKIIKQMFYSRCLLIFAGNNTLRYWIKQEVYLARKFHKKIIVVRKDYSKLIPGYLESKADEIIPFEGRTIIECILNR